MCALLKGALLLLPWTIIDHKFADVPQDEGDLRFVEVEKVCEDEEEEEGNSLNKTQKIASKCCTVVDIIDRKM